MSVCMDIKFQKYAVDYSSGSEEDGLGAKFSITFICLD
jgi:hypothetical protein